MDQGHGAAVQIHVPVDGGNDSIGIGAPKGCTQRIADGNHRIAHPQCGGIAELGGGQVCAVDSQHCQIGYFIKANQTGGVISVIRQLHRYGISILYHMGIGNDISVGGENDTGAGETAAAALAGNGNDRGNIPGVDFLKGNPAALRDIVDALRSSLKVHGCDGGG